MKKIFYSLISLVCLSACSSENAVLDALRVDDVNTSTCKTALSPTETRSDFYAANYGKPAILNIDLGEDGTAQCLLEDVEANCSVENILVNIANQDNQIDLIVYHKPLEAQANCICNFDVDFRISKLTPGKYTLNVYYATPNLKYSESTMAYNGQIDLSQNKKVKVTLKPEIILPDN